MSLDFTTGHMTRPAPSTATKEDSSRRSKITKCTLTVQGEARAAAVKQNNAVPQRPSVKVGWPAEAETRWITEHNGDPEEELPQSQDETAEELGTLYDAES